MLDNTSLLCYLLKQHQIYLEQVQAHSYYVVVFLNLAHLKFSAQINDNIMHGISK